MVSEPTNECTHQIAVQMEPHTWRCFLDMLKDQDVFDTPAEAVAWFIRAEMADTLAMHRSHFAGLHLERDDIAWPFMTYGKPASWADAVASAKAEGRRIRMEHHRCTHQTRRESEDETEKRLAELDKRCKFADEQEARRVEREEAATAAVGES